MSTTNADFKVKKGLVVNTTASFLSTVTSTSTTTGGVILSGGIGIAKDVYIGGNIVGYGTIVAGGVRSTSSSTPPVNPTVGDIWYDTASDDISRYTSDGTSSYWLDITGPTVANVNFGTNNTFAGLTTTGDILPGSNGVYNIGSPTLRFRTLYVTSATIDLGGTTISVNSTTNALHINSDQVVTTASIVNLSIAAQTVAGGVGVYTLSAGTGTAVSASSGTVTVWNTTPGFSTGTLVASAVSAQVGTTTAYNNSSTSLATTSFVQNVIPKGVILMWGGATTTIPTGWQLCDGTNSTPDLRSKFIVGASASGGYTVAATGGSADAVVVSHNHTASSSVTDPGHFHTSNWYNINDYNQGSNTPGAEQFPDDQQGNFNKDTDTKTTGITVSTTVSSSGVSATNANLPPYYALCYIQKMF